MTNQEIMDLADEYLYDNGGRTYGIIEFARAIESRTRASAIGEWFEEGKRVEREACAKLLEDSSGTNKIVSCLTAAKAIRSRGE